MTSPPCMNGVIWLVADRPALISPSDLTLWRVLINQGKPNNREVTTSHPHIVHYPNQCLQGALKLASLKSAVGLSCMSFLLMILLLVL